MGNKHSGRRPQPTALKVLRGTARKYPNAPNEPQFPRADDAFDLPPFEIQSDAIAMGEWTRVVPLLRRVGLVSAAERGSLIALCQMWSRYCEMQTRVRGEGMLIETERGPMVNPLIGIQDRTLSHLLKLWIELGLTPSGRARVSALPIGDAPPKPSKWAGVL